MSVVLMTFGVSIFLAASAPISIVPQPVSLTMETGQFQLTGKTNIISDQGGLKEAQRLACLVKPATGFHLNVVVGKAARGTAISLILDSKLANLGREGYQLTVTPSRVAICASQDVGLFYGIQSLLQLLPPQIFREAPVSGVEWTIPCVKIEDYPRFGWRGLMLDVSRHFMPREFVKKSIDLMALQKMNSLHLHLTDDQGWRIEIKKYPRLTEIGAWRKETLVGHLEDKNGPKFDGQRHGGFYTQDDIREIVAYARERYINVVPEIEMPGHAQAAIAAYTELGVTGKPLEVFTTWGVNKNIFNPSEKTILFLQDVLTEVIDLFPSPFIHVGGDEAVKTQWKSSPEVQERIKSLGLKDEHEMQSYFITQMDKFLTAKGRRLIGWDEILEGGLAPNATVMSWRGEKGGITAAKAGHDVVMAPTDYTYLDYCQSKEPDKEPLGIGGYLPLEVVYNYEPVPKELNAEEAKRVLGAQGQLWTEYISNPKHAEYMLFPRAAALAETTWTPRNRKDFVGFLERMAVQQRRWDILDVNYRPVK
jgi:hexosaminidase